MRVINRNQAIRKVGAITYMILYSLLKTFLETTKLSIFKRFYSAEGPATN
jgi:hypothetical protein